MQVLGCLQGSGYHGADGDYGCPGALSQDHSLAQLKPVVFVVDQRQAGTAQPDVEGAFGVSSHPDYPGGLYGVGGDNHDKAGQGTGQGQVFDSLVRGTVLTDRDTAVSGDQLHIQSWLGNGHTDLVKTPSGNKNGEGTGERYLTGGRQSGGDAHHVLLRDAAVENPFGELAGEEMGHG